MDVLNVFPGTAMIAKQEKSLTTTSQRSEDRERTKQILDLDISFIASDEFEAMFASNSFPLPLETNSVRRPKSPRLSGDDSHLSCLAPALNEPLLTFAEEQHEFRRMNFFKFSASQLCLSLNLARPSRKKLDRIEQFLAEAKRVRDHIVRSNLRLVISNAGKYRSTHYGFEDLVSDGSLALMEAADKFDYQRGFRFSTYATHAIRRSFFRKIERRQKDRQRFAVTDPEIMASSPDQTELDHDAPAQNLMITQIMATLSKHLTERELHIIEGRFGLNGRSEPLTLVELSGELGICKERVRQVEGHALRKLHAVALEYAHLQPKTPVPASI
jgi:RNA polymerase sigma factor (sigma-70 family)